MTKPELLKLTTFKQVQHALAKYPELLDEDIAAHVNALFSQLPNVRFINEDGTHIDYNLKKQATAFSGTVLSS